MGFWILPLGVFVAVFALRRACVFYNIMHCAEGPNACEPVPEPDYPKAWAILTVEVLIVLPIVIPLAKPAVAAAVGVPALVALLKFMLPTTAGRAVVIAVYYLLGLILLGAIIGPLVLIVVSMYECVD